MEKDGRQLLTLGEAAKKLLVTKGYISQLVKAGTLTAYRLSPRRVFIYEDSIEGYIDANNRNK